MPGKFLNVCVPGMRPTMIFAPEGTFLTDRSA